MAQLQLWFTTPALLCLVSLSFVTGTTFTIINNCTHPVWPWPGPGVLANAESTPLSTTGFFLQEGQSMTLSSPPSWSGRFWARTLCTTHESMTTDLLLKAPSFLLAPQVTAVPTPPSTLAEFTLNGAEGLDF
ncbi:hypothetical protein Sjap_016767 [Stephania japonica]|uniref:Uncharacterized protein n=1 Tax=Stephania japonica TaxID=461633 RepID=A0AAP0I4W7_9MAGN